MKESELIEAIDAFTKSHGHMPTRICGAFIDLAECAEFASYCTTQQGGYYQTILGPLTLELDFQAQSWYLA